jgi:uncharacterized protein YndB with AHSA1/START domain
MNFPHRSLFLCAALLLVGTANAEVRDTRDGAFRIETSVSSSAPPAAVYAALGKVAKWWDSAHTWSGSARNLNLELRAGGCFCEKLANGGSVQHARVIFAQPGKMLRLTGALGPLQDMAVTGVLTFTLAPEGTGTRITMSYGVSGSLSMEAAKLAPLVDQVMGGQLERLRGYANAGK